MSSQAELNANKNHRSLIGRCLITAFALFVSLQATGCTTTGTVDFGRCLDGPLSKFRERTWAQRAYNMQYADCDRPYGDHFRNGFIEGYCSVCSGQDGYVPALPPEDYWGQEYQCAEGSKCVNAWFEGYPAGAAAARKDGAGDYHNIFISKMANTSITQDKAEHVLPADVPIMAPKDVDTEAPANVPMTWNNGPLQGGPGTLGATIDPMVNRSFTAPDNSYLAPLSSGPSTIQPAGWNY